MAVAIPAEHLRRFANYRMPAEWEPHIATYLVWPHNLETWPGKFEPIPPIFARMAAALACFEEVRILVRAPEQMAHIRELISAAPTPGSTQVRMDRIELLHIPTNDSWIRDHGPIFVNRRAIGGGGSAQIAMDWRFNSWGEKYGAYDLDDVVPRKLGERYGFEVVEPDLVLEGGSLDVNGEGVLLTTESCLLNPNRNPNLSREQIEQYLRCYLGAEIILWLGEGIAGDDTDGHVDDLARFTAPDTIVTVIEQDPADANYAPLRDNLGRLRAMCDARGHRFRIETLPMPPPLYYDNVRLPASYANFYVANHAVLMPSFGCASDQAAQATLARLFPGREVIGIPSTDLVWGLGAIHCLTQQHPAPPP
ncbi:MAG TPA: agmatine deiminase family protein [Candidatus Binataceae bacterium]|nr:agmatine deiminase family protein [Candidatus Binataceae bacterium]